MSLFSRLIHCLTAWYDTLDKAKMADYEYRAVEINKLAHLIDAEVRKHFKSDSF